MADFGVIIFFHFNNIIGKSTTLKHIEIDGFGLINFDKIALDQINILEVLILKATRFKPVHQKIFQNMLHLRKFVFSEIIFQDSHHLPINFLSNMKDLEYIDYSRNDLTSLTDLNQLLESLIDRERLETLILESNKIKQLPEIIGKLKSLKKLSLMKNEIESLPESIGDLNCLEHVNLKKNRLKSLPDTIENLNSLKKLNIKKNYPLCKHPDEENKALLEKLHEKGVKIHL
ncbi:MAG: hypothetical protein GF311_23940 [Candidatus Lokiarchaeota archaeon]|nr:hypothetical protein [Candidatus Lokiarchaeota archaeon]